MEFALTHPNDLKKLIVVDMGIKRYTGGHEEIFEALRSVDLSQIHYRSDAEKILLEKIHEFGVRQFLLKSLHRLENGTYEWKFNLEALYNNYSDNILSAINSSHVYIGETLFISGGNSNYITRQDWPAIEMQFPNAKWSVVQGAGHWVHADKPEELLEVLGGFLGT